MRKALAYFVSIFALFTLGLLILHPSYRALSDWLGPLLGSHIYTLFTFIYLLLANPLRYITVAIVWVFIGLLIGVISGKKLGASITAIIVWVSVIPILVASIIGIYFNLEARGLFNQETIEALNLIPVIPDQLTLSSLFEIPIFSDLVFQLMEIVPTMGENINPMSLMFDIGMPYLVSIALKLVLIVISAIIGAFISSMIFDAVGTILPSRKTATTMALIGILCSPVVVVSAPMNFDDGIYTELIGGYVEEQGRAIVAELLLGNEVEFIPLDTPETNDLVATIVLTHKIYDPDVLYSLPFEGAPDYLHFTNMMPSTFAVTVYLGDDTDSIQSKSNQVISTVEQNLGIQFHEITTMPLPNEGGPEATFPVMTATVYYSENTIEATTANILQGFGGTGGFADVFEEKIAADAPLDIEMYVTGFVHIDPFKELLPIPEVPEEFQDLIDYFVESRFSFLAGIQLVKDAVEPQGSNYIFDLKDILSISSSISYAPESDASFIITARSNLTGVTDSLDPTIFIKTSIPEDSFELMFLTHYLQGFGASDIQSGSPTILDTQMIVPEVTLPEVSLIKSSQTTGGETEITLTVTNNGDTTIRDLKLKDYFPMKYDIQVSGQSATTWTSLGAGQSVSMNYVIDAGNPGSYTDIPAILNYKVAEIDSSTASNTIDSFQKSPNPVSMLSDTYQAATGLLNMASNGMGRMLTMGIIVFILLIAAIDVFKLFRNRSNGVEPEEIVEFSPPGEPEDTSEDLL